MIIQVIKKVLKNLTNFVIIIIIVCKFYCLYNKKIMTKKEYLVKILEQLEPIWELAPGLKLVVEQWSLWDDVLDTLITAVESGIHVARSEVAKTKMKKWLDALQKMRQIEEQSAMQDEKELAELDNLINDF